MSKETARVWKRRHSTRERCLLCTFCLWCVLFRYRRKSVSLDFFLPLKCNIRDYISRNYSPFFLISFFLYLMSKVNHNMICCKLQGLFEMNSLLCSLLSWEKSPYDIFTGFSHSDRFLRGIWTVSRMKRGTSGHKSFSSRIFLPCAGTRKSRNLYDTP